MKRWSVLLMLTAAVLMSGAVSIAATATKEKPLKVALILPGKKDDVSWNQAMYESAKALEKKLGDKGKVTITENVYEVADIEPALRDFASEGYDVIIGHGFQ
ncbi:MAG: BMP family ABC transporter substrate-binding protein, partial [Candidatus Euphemobacter frigidus]|nr:BMP family ABC transporter substrate-binding protein [Candidatus Euphemobacter frigidus]